MRRHAIILGIGSDIGREISVRLLTDGWSVTCYRHNEPPVRAAWDLIVCCYGTLEPIGPFWEQESEQWEEAFEVNLFKPLRQVRALYPLARPGASVCLFSGAGTGGPAPTYSAYAASKVALVKAVELMDDESPDCKFFVLGPGMVDTKIHLQTLQAGYRAANHDRVEDFIKSGGGSERSPSHDDIYACLMACVEAPKAAVGGRNICVHLDDWSRLGELAADPDMFKLRRAGDSALRGVAGWTSICPVTKRPCDRAGDSCSWPSVGSVCEREQEQRRPEVSRTASLREVLSRQVVGPSPGHALDDCEIDAIVEEFGGTR